MEINIVYPADGSTDRLGVGYIIEIVKDQYGHPIKQVNPKTRKTLDALQQFRIKAIDTSGTFQLEVVKSTSNSK